MRYDYVVGIGLFFVIGFAAGQCSTERRLLPKRQLHTYEVVTEYISLEHENTRVVKDTITAPKIRGLVLGQYVHEIDSRLIGQSILLAEYAEVGYNYYPYKFTSCADLVPLDIGVNRFISFRELD